MNNSEIVIETKNKENWVYPPSLSKSGRLRSTPEIKEVIEIHSNLVKEPVLLTSDLHEYAYKAMNEFNELYGLRHYHVICVGDMAGTGRRGSDANPFETYRLLAQHAKSLYFVQGNHDLPDPLGRELALKNTNGTYCMLRDSLPIETELGKIVGVNGTISDKPHPYKKPQNQFIRLVEKALRTRPRIFLTHETPALPKNERERHIGNAELYYLINKYKPEIHIYGHCHHPGTIKIINGVIYINADSRIILLQPT